MNPDTGEDAEDWFAKFEREARETAAKRDGEPDAAAPPASTPPPVAPQIANPFDAPTPPTTPPTAAPTWQQPPPAQPPAAPAWPQPPVAQPPAAQPPAQPPVAQPPVAPPPLQQPPAAQPIAPWEQPPVSPWDTPTQAVPWQEPGATQAMPALGEEPTQALVPAPLRPPGEPEPAEPTSALDSLFGDDRFRDYQDGLGPDPSNAPFAGRSRSKELVHVPGEGTPPPPRVFGRTQKILAGVGGGLLAVIALIGLFLLGTRLPDVLGPAPAVATPTPTPTPSALTELPIGPVPPGEYAWDELLGGECLEPYDAAEGAWAEEFTVVDCAEPHTAQMVYRAFFPDEVDPLDPQGAPVRPAFPGVDALQARITLLCSAAGVVDYAAAGAYSDAQIQGSYPVTEEQWELDNSYYCFVSRSSGEALIGSLAIPRVAPDPAVPVTP